jgi:CDP-diacylglycerol--glycerol-3-phosphate 3-phosphatidyltransferase
VDGDDLEAYVDRWSRAHGGYDARSSRPTMAWLRLAHGLGAPLARRGVPASWVTATGGVGAVAVGGVAALGGRWALLAAALVVVVAVLDGIDGAVAELTGTSSAWGQVLDQLVDRIGDVAMIAGLWVLGAPGPLCAAAAVLTLLDESIRSSAGAAGMVEIGVVSLPERPARLVVGGLSLAAAGAVPSAAALIVTVGATVWTAMTLAATVQLVVNVRRRLHGQPRKVLDADPGD